MIARHSQRRRISFFYRSAPFSFPETKKIPLDAFPANVYIQIIGKAWLYETKTKENRHGII